MKNLRKAAEVELNNHKEYRKEMRSYITLCKSQIDKYKQCKDVEYKNDNKREIKDLKRIIRKAKKLIVRGRILTVLCKILIIIGIFEEMLEGKDEK